MHMREQHVVTALVALASFGLALDQGGYSTGFFAGAAFAVWWLILACVVLRLMPADLPRAAVATGASLALYAAWMGLSWLWAADNGVVLTEIVRTLLYLGVFTWVALFPGRGGARPWLAGLAIGLTGVAILSLATRFDPSLIDAGYPGSRLNYPIGYWNALAALAAMAITLLAWYAAHGQDRLTRAFATAAMPLPALAIFLSGSRGGVAAAALGLTLLVALGPRRFPLVASILLAGLGGAVLLIFAHGQPELVDGLSGSVATSQGRNLLLVSVAVVVAAGAIRHQIDGLLSQTTVPRPLRLWVVALGLAALLGLIVAENPIERFESFKESPVGVQAPVSGNFTNDNGSGRYQFWDAAIEALEDQPLHGIGAGQYATWWSAHGSIDFVIQDAHSLLFESAAELGLIGVILVMAFFFATIQSGWRRRGNESAVICALLALLAAGVLSALIDWMWELPAVFAPVVVTAALLTGRATEAASSPPSPARSQTARPVILAAVGAVAWISIVCSGDVLVTEVELSQSRSQVAEGDLVAAAESADNAIALAPWAAGPRVQLALVQQRAGNLPAARSSLEDAIDRSPDRWQFWFLLSQVERREHRLVAARAALAQALRLNPRSRALRQRLAAAQRTGP
jgi:hypothetical protein